MALSTKTGINIAEYENHYIDIASQNIELALMTVHLVVRGIDGGQFNVRLKQGNDQNKIDRQTNQLVGDDIMVEILDCDGGSTLTTISADGNYFIAVDSYYGKYANIVLERETATAGKIDVYVAIAKKK